MTREFGRSGNTVVKYYVIQGIWLESHGGRVMFYAVTHPGYQLSKCGLPFQDKEMHLKMALIYMTMMRGFFMK